MLDGGLESGMVKNGPLVFCAILGPAPRARAARKSEAGVVQSARGTIWRNRHILRAKGELNHHRVPKGGNVENLVRIWLFLAKRWFIAKAQDYTYTVYQTNPQEHAGTGALTLTFSWS